MGKDDGVLELVNDTVVSLLPGLYSFTLRIQDVYVGADAAAATPIASVASTSTTNTTTTTTTTNTTTHTSSLSAEPAGAKRKRLIMDDDDDGEKTVEAIQPLKKEENKKEAGGEGKSPKKPKVEEPVIQPEKSQQAPVMDSVTKAKVQILQALKRHRLTLFIGT